MLALFGQRKTELASASGGGKQGWRWRWCREPDKQHVFFVYSKASYLESLNKRGY